MAADLGTVEVRLEVHQVCHAIAAVQGIGDNVRHEAPVEPGLLEGPFQALALRAVVMEAMVVRGLASGGSRQGFGCWRLGAHGLHFHRSAGDLLTVRSGTRASGTGRGPNCALRGARCPSVGRHWRCDVGGQDGRAVGPGEDAIAEHLRDLRMGEIRFIRELSAVDPVEELLGPARVPSGRAALSTLTTVAPVKASNRPHSGPPTSTTCRPPARPPGAPARPSAEASDNGCGGGRLAEYTHGQAEQAGALGEGSHAEVVHALVRPWATDHRRSVEGVGLDQGRDGGDVVGSGQRQRTPTAAPGHQSGGPARRDPALIPKSQERGAGRAAPPQRRHRSRRGHPAPARFAARARARRRGRSRASPDHCGRRPFQNCRPVNRQSRTWRSSRLLNRTRRRPSSATAARHRGRPAAARRRRC